MENSLKLTALPPEMLVNILKQAGSRLISAEKLAADFDAGAPKNEDGTINLIEFAALPENAADAGDYIAEMNEREEKLRNDIKQFIEHPC